MASHTEETISAKPSITIAIDFGTTFSGAAWHWSENPGCREIVNTWPDSNNRLDGFTDDKVPTKIVYGNYGKPNAWGNQIDASMNRYQEFKLLLGGQKKLPETRLTNQFPDSLGLPISDYFNATKLTTDYLRCLKEHVLSTISTQIHEHTVRTNPIQWTLTIPAIWNDQQKGSTRFCAKEAGMGDRVRLVTEPEAAIIHAIDSMKAEELSVGQTFILCDCGGGTVDLITYVVEQLSPLQVKELVQGDGDRCGGVYVDRAFAQYIRNKFSGCEGWSEDVVHAAVQKFERITKRKFDDSDDRVVIRVSGLADMNHKGISVRKGKAFVPSADIRGIYEPVIVIIKRLVQEQIAASRSKQHQVTALLLVGGFGQSPYLKRELQGIVGSTINVWQVRDGRTAIVKGALLKALNDANPENATIEVTSRVARKYYGISRGIIYEDDKNHDKLKRYWVDVEQTHYVQVAHWFIKQGAPIPERHPQPFNYYEAWHVGTKAPTFTVHVLAWDGPTVDEPTPPRYDEDNLHIATLQVDLSRIPVDKLTRSWDRKRQKSCYECFPDIQIAYKSAGLEYSLWYQDVCYGQVEAKYA